MQNIKENFNYQGKIESVYGNHLIFKDEIDGAAAFVDEIEDYEYDDVSVPTGGDLIFPNAHSVKHEISKNSWGVRTKTLTNTFDDYTCDVQLDRTGTWTAHLGVLQLKIDMTEEADASNEQAVFLTGDLSDFTFELRPNKCIAMFGNPVITLLGTANHNKFGRNAISILLSQAYQGLVTTAVDPRLTVRIHVKFTDWAANFAQHVAMVTNFVGSFNYVHMKVFNPRMRVRRRAANRRRQKPRPPRELTKEELDEMEELSQLVDESIALGLTDEELLDAIGEGGRRKRESSLSYFSFPELLD